MAIKDADGHTIKAGDTIVFSYGIPGVRVEALVVDVKGHLWALTPKHTPDRCRLDKLVVYVGPFWKLGKRYQ